MFGIRPANDFPAVELRLELGGFVYHHCWHVDLCFSERAKPGAEPEAISSSCSLEKKKCARAPLIFQHLK